MLGITAITITFLKEFFSLVIRHHMTDNETVKLVWEVMVLKRRFEDNPYSLSLEDIKVLRNTAFTRA